MNFSRLYLLILPVVLGLPLLAGGCAAPVAVAAASYGADGVSLVSTGKTSSDHFVSMVSKKDCALWRIFRRGKICREREDDHDPYNVNYNEAFRSQSESGVEYAPPLRATAEAPPTSWTEATYKPAPGTEPAAPAEPTRAVAETMPEPAPVAASPPPAPKPKKTGPARSAGKKVKKPSRGQVASSR